MYSNMNFMLKHLSKKHISIGLMVLFFIFAVYTINTKNLTSLIISVSILIIYLIFETVWILNKREYKTIYWIAISNALGIFCISATVFLVFEGKNLTDFERVANHVLVTDRIHIALYASMILSSFLKSEIFKINKDMLGHESRDE